MKKFFASLLLLCFTSFALAQSNYDLSVISKEASAALQAEGLSVEQTEGLELYFQEMYLTSKADEIEDRSRVLVLAPAVAMHGGATLRAGYILQVKTMTKEPTVVLQTTDEQGNFYFSACENTGSLIIRLDIIKQGKKAVQAATQELQSQLVARYPQYIFNPLMILGAVNVALPDSLSLKEKVEYISFVQSLDLVAPATKLMALNPRDVIIGGSFFAPPAVKLSSSGTIDIDSLRVK